MAIIQNYYPDKTESELQLIKDAEFAAWLQYYVCECIESGQSLPTWLVEFANGLNPTATSYPRFCTRGYAFRIRAEGTTRPTSDYGISAQSGDVVYYGILQEILEVRYPGMLDLRCIVFMCDWYDPIVGHGIRIDQLGVISIHSRRRLLKYDPFILASQADQVCYIPYPRVTHRSDHWITVTPMKPRGIIYGVPEHDALQGSRSIQMDHVEEQNDINLVVDFTQVGDDRIHSESEEANEEFDDDSDSIPSEDSSGNSE